MPLAATFQPAASSARCAATGSDQPGPEVRLLPWHLSGLRFPRAFPVLPGLFYRFHFVPKELVFRAVGLDDHPVLPGRYHLSGAVAPGNRVASMVRPCHV